MRLRVALLLLLVVTIAVGDVLLLATPALAQEPSPDDRAGLSGARGKRRPTPVRPGRRRATPRATDEAEGPAAPVTPPQKGRARPFETGIEYERPPRGTRFTFNLEDADLPDLIRVISQMTGRQFIMTGKVRSIKASVFSPTQVTPAQAYNAFLSILEMNGMTVVQSGRYLKIVDSQQVQKKPVPLNTGRRGTASNDGFQTRLHRLENLGASDAAQLLSQFSGEDGSVIAYAPTNSLIITDTGANIRRMLRIVQEIDIHRSGERFWIEKIHYRDAADLANQLQEVFPATVGATTGSMGAAASPAARPAPRRGQPAPPAAGGGARAQTIGSGGAMSTRLIPDGPSNSIMIIATEATYHRILELIRILDRPGDSTGGIIHVYPVQYGDANDLAATLSSLVGGGQRGGSPSTKGQKGAARRAPGAPPGAPAAAVAAAQAASAGTAAAGTAGVFLDDVGITAHEPTNALVITATPQDYVSILSVLHRLDSRPRQVFIEAVIMELSVNRSNELGFAFHGGIGDFPTPGSLSVFGFEAIKSLQTISEDSLTGLALGVRGPDIPGSEDLIGFSIPGFGVAIHALARSGDANVLSTPHVIAMDNVQAEISVGQNVPLQTSGPNLGSLAGLAGLGTTGGTGAAGLAGLANLGGGLGYGSVQRQDVGTTIRITPHINESDEVRLEIEEEISERGATEGTLGVVSIDRRSAKTEALVRDQQTVVIGGLMRDVVTTAQTKIPILGDIPLLGALFRRTERSKQKSNLLLFLTPYIIRDPSDLRAIFERKMRERQEFLDRYFVFAGDDYEPPIDYSRTRGLALEILNELDNLTAEHQLMQINEGRIPPEHTPQAPLGDAPIMTVEGEVDYQDGDAEAVESEGAAEASSEGAPPTGAEAGQP